MSRLHRLAVFAALALASALAQAADAKRILFVGNSYTYVNNVPAIVEALAKRADPQAAPVADMLVAPGVTLEQILDEETFESVMEKGRYDTVVLQEKGGFLICLTSAQRPRPPECGASVNAHRKMAKIARKFGAKDILVFGTFSMTPDKQPSVSRGTRQVASSIKAKNVDVGAMLEVAKTFEGLPPLFYPDLHLQPAGATLAAIALYEAIYGRRVAEGEFRAEIPVWPGMTNFSARRPVSMQKRLPQPETLEIAFTADEMRGLLAAAHR